MPAIISNQDAQYALNLVRPVVKRVEAHFRVGAQ